jgi:hypothetical protein
MFFLSEANQSMFFYPGYVFYSENMSNIFHLLAASMEFWNSLLVNPDIVLQVKVSLSKSDILGIVYFWHNAEFTISGDL